MEHPAGSIRIEELLAHREWVGRVARALVSDGARAEDLEQEVWTSILERPPAKRPRSIRAWLGTILRFKAIDGFRAEARRRRRETDVARRESPLPPDEVVARGEILKRVVAAVMDLDEPYRSTVLLRYFEGLPPSAIATHQGVPAETVHTRLRRAMAILRGRLDAEHRGDRRTWSVLLLSVLRRSRPIAAAAPAAVATGVVLMMTKAKIACLSAALVLLAGGIFVVSRTPPREVRTTRAREAAGRNDSAPVRIGDGDPETAPAPVESSGAFAPREPRAPRVTGIRGRVLNARRFPVKGAEIVLEREDGVSRTVRSEADGSFDVAVGSPVDAGITGTLRARDGKGNAAIRGIRQWEDSDLGALVLLPAGTVEVHVVEGSAPVAGAIVRIGQAKSVTTGDDGTAVFRDIPECRMTVFASAGVRGRGQAHVGVVRGQVSTVTVRVTSRDVEITVVEAGSGTPIAGARVEVWELRFGGIGRRWTAGKPPLMPPLTDAAGRTRIRSVGRDEPFVLRVHAPGYPEPRSWNGRVGVAEGATEVRIELSPGRTIRWPVTDGECPVPADGTEIDFYQNLTWDRERLHRSGRMEGGCLVVSGFGVGAAGGYAVLRDGSFARLFASAGTEAGRETSFCRFRSLEVRVRDTAGASVEGIGISLRDPGNNPLGASGRTDRDGRILLRSLYDRPVDVYVLVRRPWGGIKAGRVDLGPGDGRLEVVVGPEKVVEIRVTLDGRPGLPSSYSLHVGKPGMSQERVIDVEEDPAKGVLRFRRRTFPVGSETPLVLRVGREFTRVLSIPPGVPDSGVVSLSVDVRGKPGAVVVKFVPSLDKGRSRLEIHRLGPDDLPDGKGNRAEGLALSRLEIRFEFLQPGRYRVADRSTGFLSDPVDVVSGATPPEVRIDLSRAGWVSGHVEVRDGVHLEKVRVLREAPGIWFSPPRDLGVRLGVDGAFRVRVPGDRAVTIRAVVPDTEHGGDEASAVVRDPMAGLVLRVR